MKHLSELATLLIALMFLAVLTCWPLMAFTAEEPAVIAKVRAAFLADVAKAGMDAKQCSLTYIESIPEGHIIETVCANLPLRCLFLAHPTEPMVAPLQCVQNFDYKPTTKT